MDIKQMEFFVVACERGSFSKAAECLYTSQPNISKNIRVLEHELGRPLLMRTGKGGAAYTLWKDGFGARETDFEKYCGYFFTGGSGGKKQLMSVGISQQYDCKAPGGFL